MYFEDQASVQLRILTCTMYSSFFLRGLDNILKHSYRIKEKSNSLTLPATFIPGNIRDILNRRRSPGGALWRSPGGTPWNSPGGTLWRSPGGTPWRSPGGTPWRSPGGTPWRSPGGTLWRSPGGTPWRSPGGTPWRSPGGTPPRKTLHPWFHGTFWRKIWWLNWLSFGCLGPIWIFWSTWSSSGYLGPLVHLWTAWTYFRGLRPRTSRNPTIRLWGPRGHWKNWISLEYWGPWISWKTRTTLRLLGPRAPWNT